MTCEDYETSPYFKGETMTIQEAYEILKPMSREGRVSITLDYASYCLGLEPGSHYTIIIDGVVVVSYFDGPLEDAVESAAHRLESARLEAIERAKATIERLTK